MGVACSVIFVTEWLRSDYRPGEKDGSGDLDADWLADGWLPLLHKWFDLAVASGIPEPNAMVLATVDNGRPVTRTVLCKGFDPAGVTFFSNYDSAKGRQLDEAPYASVTFPWYALGRQVHVRGRVTKVDPAQTADYWAKRPRGSQLGAWASQQSAPIESRAALLAQLDDITQRFADLDQIPVPPQWGGYVIAPENVEFWQGRENRVHNRIVVAVERGSTERPDGTVRIQRLQP